MGRRSEAALPELRTISLMQPTKDSIMYFTPWSFSSELNPEKVRIKVKPDIMVGNNFMTGRRLLFTHIKKLTYCRLPIEYLKYIDI